MSTATTRAALVKPATTEFYDVAIFNANADKIDNLLGFTPCTSNTRPSAPIAGQGILESDTGAALVSNGSSPASASWSYLHGTGGFTTVGGTGATAALRIQTTATISGNRVIDFRKSGDTNACYIADFDGRMQWGPGGSGGPDVNLYRVSSGMLKTDQSVTVSNTLFAASVQAGGALLEQIDRGIVGGRQITGSNNLGSTITTTETEPTNMDSGSVTLTAGRRYRIWCRYKATFSVANDQFLVRIRQGASAGTGGVEIREEPVVASATGLGFTRDIVAEYEAASSGAVVFSFTAIRLSGTGNVQFSGGGSGSTNLVGVWVEDNGPSAKLTTTAS